MVNFLAIFAGAACPAAVFCDTVQDMERYRYINKHQPVLVAVSGGADSVALLHTLVTAGFYCIAAHCNFHLRGAESDADERFVRGYCDELSVPCHVAHFDTRAIAAARGISIEMAARELRYQWFDRLMDEQNIPCVAVAHHSDDAAETFLLNLVRGTGIRGLSGMKEVSGRIVRPLLRYSRQDIELYCRAHKLKYVTDSTNLSDAYTRNRIRHHIIPQFKAINPSFLATMRGNMKHLNQICSMFMAQVDEFKRRAVVDLDGQMLISMTHLVALPNVEPFLFELLSPLGFTSDAVHKVARCVTDSRWGRLFFSPTHRAIVDRFNIVVQPRDKQVEQEEFNIETEQTEVFRPIGMRIRRLAKEPGYQVSRDPRVAHFDASKIYFPLTLRRWQNGDTFRPLGMKGFKKLSDFFVDNKLSRAEKEEVWVLISGGEIAWIVGRRIDDRYKVVDSTTNIIEISLD